MAVDNLNRDGLSIENITANRPEVFPPIPTPLFSHFHPLEPLQSPNLCCIEAELVDNRETSAGRIALRVPILGAIEAISVFEVLANFKKSLVYVKTESRLKPLFCTLRSVIFFRRSHLFYATKTLSHRFKMQLRKLIKIFLLEKYLPSTEVVLYAWFKSCKFKVE